MKTAISLPDETFSRADRRAHELGISRSEFFALAARHYLDMLDADSLTEQIDEVLNGLDGTETSEVVAAGHRRLRDIADEW